MSKRHYPLRVSGRKLTAIWDGAHHVHIYDKDKAIATQQMEISGYHFDFIRTAADWEEYAINESNMRLRRIVYNAWAKLYVEDVPFHSSETALPELRVHQDAEGIRVSLRGSTISEYLRLLELQGELATKPFLTLTSGGSRSSGWYLLVQTSEIG